MDNCLLGEKERMSVAARTDSRRPTVVTLRKGNSANLYRVREILKDTSQVDKSNDS